MSTLAHEIDQTLQALDPTTAATFERLIRDALTLVNPQNLKKAAPEIEVRFPLTKGVKIISDEDVARLQDEL